MAKTNRSSGKKKTALVDELQPGEAVVVLRRLLARHPELLSEAEEMSRSTLGEVSLESIARAVEDAIWQLSLDDLNDRAGPHSWGYTEPTEAAWELLEEAVEPFVLDMKRHLRLGLGEEAFEMCKGIVLGLYRCRNASGDVLGWAEDLPADAAGKAISDWIGAGKAGHSDGEPGAHRAGLLRRLVDKRFPSGNGSAVSLMDRRASEAPVSQRQERAKPMRGRQ
jgi:hypothetical protein